MSKISVEIVSVPARLSVGTALARPSLDNQQSSQQARGRAEAVPTDGLALARMVPQF